MSQLTALIEMLGSTPTTFRVDQLINNPTDRKHSGKSVRILFDDDKKEDVTFVFNDDGSLDRVQ